MKTIVLLLTLSFVFSAQANPLNPTLHLVSSVFEAKILDPTPEPTLTETPVVPSPTATPTLAPEIEVLQDLEMCSPNCSVSVSPSNTNSSISYTVEGSGCGFCCTTAYATIVYYPDVQTAEADYGEWPYSDSDGWSSYDPETGHYYQEEWIKQSYGTRLFEVRAYYISMFPPEGEEGLVGCVYEELYNEAVAHGLIEPEPTITPTLTETPVVPSPTATPTVAPEIEVLQDLCSCNPDVDSSGVDGSITYFAEVGGCDAGQMYAYAKITYYPSAQAAEEALGQWPYSDSGGWYDTEPDPSNEHYAGEGWIKWSYGTRLFEAYTSYLSLFPPDGIPSADCIADDLRNAAVAHGLIEPEPTITPTVTPEPTPTPVDADLDNNGTVDQEDLLELMRQWHK